MALAGSLPKLGDFAVEIGRPCSHEFHVILVVVAVVEAFVLGVLVAIGGDFVDEVDFVGGHIGNCKLNCARCRVAPLGCCVFIYSPRNVGIVRVLHDWVIFGFYDTVLAGAIATR